MRHRALLLIPMSLLLAAPGAWSQELELPQLTPDQRWQRLEFHYATLFAGTGSYLKSHGQTLEAYAHHLGQQFAPSWGEGLTPGRLLRGWYRNAAAWRDLDFDVIHVSDSLARATSNRPWAEAFGEQGILGTTAEELEKTFAIAYQEIAAHQGLSYDQRLEGNLLIITARRGGSGSTPSEPSPEEDVRQRIMAHYDAINRGDLSAVVSHHTEDFSGFLMANDELATFTSHEEQRQAWGAPEVTGMTIDWRPRDIHVALVGDAAVAAFYLDGYTETPDGMRIEGPWQVTEIWVRHDGEWKEMHHHDTLIGAAAPAGEAGSR